jgi:hypothetical protein
MESGTCGSECWRIRTYMESSKVSQVDLSHLCVWGYSTSPAKSHCEEATAHTCPRESRSFIMRSIFIIVFITLGSEESYSLFRGR